MKMKTLLIGCCVTALLAFSGCRGTEEKEAPAQKETKEEAASAGVSQNAPSENSASANAPAQSQNAKPQGAKGAPGAQSDGENAGVPTEAPTETEQEETDFGQGFAQEAGQESGGESAGQEEMQQCPYCGQWFSAAPDGGLWNPFDRHVLKERDSFQADGQTPSL